MSNMEETTQEGSTEAEWYKALLAREEINKNQNIPGSLTGQGNL